MKLLPKAMLTITQEYLLGTYKSRYGHTMSAKIMMFVDYLLEKMTGNS